MNTKRISLLMYIFLCTISAFYAQEPSNSQFAALKTAPFPALKFDEEKILVQVDEGWYEWIKIDTLSVDYLLSESKNIYGPAYQKWLSEDLVELLQRVGHFPKTEARFLLKDKEGKLIEKVLSFTAENRRNSLAYFRSENPEEEVDLFQELGPKQMMVDLMFLKSVLEESYSYLGLNDFDWEREFKMLQTGSLEPQTIQEFGIRLNQFIYRFGDGHSGRIKTGIEEMGLLPFRTKAFQGKIICYDEETRMLIEPDYPFLKKINHLSVEQLLASSKEFLVPMASTQFIERVAAARLGYIGFLLRQHNDLSEQLDIEFESEDGGTYSRTFDFRDYDSESNSGRSQFYIELLSKGLFPSKILEGNLAYIRIESMFGIDARMRESFQRSGHPLSKNIKTTSERIAELMAEISNTDGLIIDVRDNGGGSREAWLGLIPYFIPPDASPIIGNVGALRINNSKSPAEGYLSDRHAYPMSSSQFDKEARKAIKNLQKGFKAQHDFDPEKYSDWHYLLMSNDPEKEHYDKPVVILMDEGCYSATDIFLSSFDQLENVTLLGRASGGGSGRSQDYALPVSKLELRLSSMISFQPNGKLYDGVGVQPDIELLPETIEDALGITDNVLERAKDILKKEKKN